MNVNTATGQASLTDCGARGIVINATLALFVQPTGPSSYQANFNGILMVSGTFAGTIDVNQAFIQWTDPATVDNTFWEVTATVNDSIFIVTSADSGNGHSDPNSGNCDECIGVNAAPPGSPPNPATQCEGPVDFACSCLTQNGETLPFFLSGVGCIY